ncbi:Nud1p [Sugiyamaella lignohabitans]|uniref:Nud1p n=1 Tax=Sugiyamaella lignohabitans TaxID=796027 RepID=A0A167DCE0_9ASCO|nr:Nud1p [Sugiyamaella lignohabitans]ANB12755.1 Nud1p [Sugiyamaella lignohabitans]
MASPMKPILDWSEDGLQEEWLSNESENDGSAGTTTSFSGAKNNSSGNGIGPRAQNRSAGPAIDWAEEGLEEEWVSEKESTHGRAGSQGSVLATGPARIPTGSATDTASRSASTVNSLHYDTRKVDNSAPQARTPEWKRAYKNNGTGSNAGNIFSSSSSSLQNLFQGPERDQDDENDSSNPNSMGKNGRNAKALSDIPEGSEDSATESNSSNNNSMREIFNKNAREAKIMADQGPTKTTVGNDSGSLGFRFFDRASPPLDNTHELSESGKPANLQDANSSPSYPNQGNSTIPDKSTNEMTQPNDSDPSQFSEYHTSSVDSTASSPLKVFQKSNTYTKGRMEDLLGSVGNRDDQTSTSSTLRHIPDTLDSLRGKKPAVSQEVNQLKDYMNEADALMNALRNQRPPVPEFSQSSSSIMSDSTDISDSTNSLNMLEISLKQHSPEIESEDEDESSNSSSLAKYENKPTNHQAQYYNSAKGVYEVGATSINEEHSSSSSSSTSYSSSKSGNQESQTNSYTQNPPSAINSHKSNANSKTTGSPVLMNPSLPSKVPGSPNKRHPAMAVITPNDLKDYNQHFDGMVWDTVNKCWRSTSQPDFGTGTTKVASSDEFDKDPFEGIDDLDDDSKGSREWELSEVIPNSAPKDETTVNSLQDLEMIPKGLTESDDSADKISQNVDLDDVVEIAKGVSNMSDISSSSSRSQPTPHPSHSVLPHKTSRTSSIKLSAADSRPKTTPNLTPNRSDKITVTSTYSQFQKREVSFQIAPEDARRLFQSKHQPFSNLSSIVTPRVNATNIFSIESSFSDVYNSIVRILNEKHPSEDWTRLLELSVAGNQFTTLLELAKLCPSLEILDASNNNLNVINGLPTSLLELNASNNKLTKLVSFKSLSHLQQLNLSNNKLDSLLPLSGLIQLTDLNVDNNDLTSLSGIDNIRGLRSLSARNNKLAIVDFQKSKWNKLEQLNLSGNRIELVKGLDMLSSLVTLDLDHNKVVSFSSTETISSVRKLSLNGNDTTIDVSKFKGLKELQFDRNKRVIGLGSLYKLEVVSFRSQTENTHVQTWETLCDIHRLYLSGNLLEAFNIREPFLNLQVLELSGVSLKALPESFPEFCLNLRELDLSFNQIQSIRPLVGIPKLRRLYLFRNQISDVGELVDCISEMSYLQVLDTRENPASELFYPPIAADDQESYRKTHTKYEQKRWLEKLSEFDQTGLSDKVKALRTVYRGTLVGSSPRGLKWLDGALIDQEEMTEALKIVRSVN